MNTVLYFENISKTLTHNFIITNIVFAKQTCFHMKKILSRESQGGYLKSSCLAGNLAGTASTGQQPRATTSSTPIAFPAVSQICCDPSKAHLEAMLMRWETARIRSLSRSRQRRRGHLKSTTRDSKGAF